MNMNIPKNIRQIGECNSSQRIYIEDYVVTFLKELSDKKKNMSAVAVLYGKMEREEDALYCFVMGAAECDTEEEKEDSVLFSEENYRRALYMQKEYFAQYDMIGWALLESEDDHIPREAIVKTQLQKFADGDKLYYEMRREDDREQFIILESGQAHVVEGYHIFYDKNEGMQNYLVKWNASQDKTYTEPAEDRAARQFRTVYYNRKEEKGQRQIIGLLYAATLILLTFCCVSGISMMNNYEKMKEMESALNHLALAMEERQLPDITSQVMSEDIIVEEIEKPEADKKTVSENIAETAETIEVPGTTAAPETTAASETIGEPETAGTPEVEVTENKTGGYILQEGSGEGTHAVYTVQKGDTLLKISRRFYNNADMIEAICELNQIENPNDIMQQQKILLP